MKQVARLDTRELDRIIRDAPVKAEKALAAAAFQVQAVAQSLAPVDTGALKNSIGTERKARFTYWVQDSVEYGIYQELGTSRMAAQPFMVPAVEQVSKDFERMLSEIVT